MFPFIIVTISMALQWAASFGWGYESGRPRWRWAFKFPVACGLSGVSLWVVWLGVRQVWPLQGIEKLDSVEWLIVIGLNILFFSSSYFSGRWLGKRHARLGRQHPWRGHRLRCTVCDDSVIQTGTSWKHCDLEVSCPVRAAYSSPRLGRLRWPGLEWRHGAWRGEADISIGCYGGAPDHWLPEEV